MLVLSEPDSRFWMGVDKTASDRFLVLGSESKETSEHYVIDLQGSAGKVPDGPGFCSSLPSRRANPVHSLP